MHTEESGPTLYSAPGTHTVASIPVHLRLRGLRNTLSHRFKAKMYIFYQKKDPIEEQEEPQSKEARLEDRTK